MKNNIQRAIGAAVLIAVGFLQASTAYANIITSIDSYTARPPIHILAGATRGPAGLFPSEVKKAYGLPSTGGTGIIAIIAAFNHPDIAGDLAAFDQQFALPPCTVGNKCLTIHPMNPSAKEDSGWSMETALDTEWAHAIAPKAKILVVEAASDSGKNLLKAVDYARERSGVAAISMSWGGNEFAGETALDKHFPASSSIAFFASSGDDGVGASWPAVSPGVIAVGGTSLLLNINGGFASEKAWSGSGGGTSVYETAPAYQKNYSIPRSGGKRAVPDVSFAADPEHGFSVYHAGHWYVVGGTSAGAPQWAAIASLALAAKDPVSLAKLYVDKASDIYTKFFRDITSGTNGDCGYFCAARKHYDYVTGLGSPLTDTF